VFTKTSRHPTHLAGLLLLLLSFLPSGLNAMAPVQRNLLSNGLVILQSEDHSLPFITMQLLIDGGSSRDPSGQEGLSHITAKALLLGSDSKTAVEISRELDFMGASLNASSGRDHTVISLRVLKKDLLKGFDLFMEALTRPIFPEEEIRREVEKTSAALQSQEDDPGTLAEREFLKALFPDSPYGRPVEGTKATLSTLTRDMILKFYRSYYIPNNSILTIAGDITPEEVRTSILPVLEKLHTGVTPDRKPRMTHTLGPEAISINRSITQANIILGHAGITRDNPDFYALSVMNYILGRGGFASRLNEEVRAKRGLAYSITSFFDAGKHSGSFQVVLQTKNESAKEAIELTLKEMEKIRKEPVSEKELESAKKYLIGSFPMRLDTQAKLASFITQSEYFGLGLDYDRKYQSLIGSITRQEVLRVANTYLHPERLIIVTVGNSNDGRIDLPAALPKAEKGKARP
jgi:zinc protease